jgi:hypothetical protein
MSLSYLIPTCVLVAKIEVGENKIVEGGPSTSSP